MAEYDWKEIKEKLIRYCKEIKIDKVGFTTAEPFFSIEKKLEEYYQKGYNSGFEENNIQLRVYPKFSLTSARSIISIAIAYPSVSSQCTIQDTDFRGHFCRASWGKDYHLVVNDKLNKLSEYIKMLIPESETLAMVDTGPLSDRTVAVRAGLGWIGKNSNLITPEFGSFVYLGQLLTNLPLPPDKMLENKCHDCTKCIKNCPMQAIIPAQKVIDCNKCLAYQTLTKGHLNDELKNKIGEHSYIYGCDICQLVCPYNQDKTNDWHADFKPESNLISPLLQDLLNISNKEFKEKFGYMSGSWRGKKSLQRNALFILGKKRDLNAVPLLSKVLFNDPRPEIRGAAAWALGNFKPTENNNILQEALKKEADQIVLAEIKKAIIKQGSLS